MPNLHHAYCPGCLHRVRKGTHQPCSQCGYETSGVAGDTWKSLRQMIEEGSGKSGVLTSNDVSLGNWTRLVADAVRAEDAYLARLAKCRVKRTLYTCSYCGREAELLDGVCLPCFEGIGPGKR